MPGSIRLSLAAAGLMVAPLAAMAGADAQHAAAPRARYQMDVITSTGMGAPGGMGGMAGMGGTPMASMFGGRGGQAQHSLELRLSSTLAPADGAPHADHVMPAGAGLGTVPLVTPIAAATPQPASPEGMPPTFRRPQGRMLIFWGCGAHAGAGQPVVIDFATLAPGTMPPQLATGDVPTDHTLTSTDGRTFGEWPNARSHQQPGAQASLIGSHRVTGNYTPAIDFTLAQDFLAPLHASATAGPDGATRLAWNAVPSATGYYAYLVGAQGRGDDAADMVMWSSADRQEIGGALAGWLAPATVARLIGQHIVMPPSQTSCTIPAEVKAAAGAMMMVQLQAYGPELAFADPPRPADPRATWRPDWTATVRYRSSTGLMLGMPAMGGMAMSGDAGTDDTAARGDRPPPAARPRCAPKGLGGMIRAGLGAGC
jgi:hypothetical protein